LRQLYSRRAGLVPEPEMKHKTHFGCARSESVAEWLLVVLMLICVAGVFAAYVSFFRAVLSAVATEINGAPGEYRANYFQNLYQ
jgi:hypothetical protein